MENGFVLGICDDDPEILRKIHRICQDVMDVAGMNLVCVEFRDGSEVLQYRDKIDLLILDIKMPNTDGLLVKQRFQERREETVLIFVTDYDDLMEEAFGIHVYGFVPKSALEQKLKPMLMSALRLIVRPSLLLKKNIESDTILFARAETPYSRLYIKDGREELYRENIGRLTGELRGMDFVRVHRSYLVNLRWIDQVPDEVVHIVGHEIPVARRIRAEVRRAYMDYARKYARYC